MQRDDTPSGGHSPRGSLLSLWLDSYKKKSLLIYVLANAWSTLHWMGRLALRRASEYFVASSRPALPDIADEPRRARTLDLAILGELLAVRLARDGVCPPGSGLARLWREHVVPRATDGGCAWQLGMTAAITGMTSPAGQPFNGVVGRISGSTVDGRWELLVEGPQGIGSVNIKPANLCAPTNLDAVVRVWRTISNRSQGAAPTPPTPALHEAVSRCERHRVETLITSGAELSETDASGRTALHVALEQVVLLAEEEEDDDDDDDGGTDASSRGAARGPSREERLELASWLLGRTADVNARDARERTPLHLAVEGGAHAVARGLLALGADQTLTCKGGNALRLAVLRRDAPMVDVLVQKPPPRGPEWLDAHGKDGWTALGLAARAGHVAVATSLLAAGADPAVVMANGKRPLDIARINKKAAVTTLLEALEATSSSGA